jgi:hypothetical protein
MQSYMSLSFGRGSTSAGCIYTGYCRNRKYQEGVFKPQKYATKNDALLYFGCLCVAKNAGYSLQRYIRRRLEPAAERNWFIFSK